MNELRKFDFTLGFDNIINHDPSSPKKLNNGVLLSAKNSSFLRLWISRYHNFDPFSWDQHSSILPYEIAASYPDLVHVEMSRISPISYGFQSATAVAAITCGILCPNKNITSSSGSTGSGQDTDWYTLAGHKFNAIWHPKWSFQTNSWTFENVVPDEYLFRVMKDKIVIHLTMSLVR